MKMNEIPFTTLTLECVVHPVYVDDAGPSRVELYTGSQSHTGWTWLDLPPAKAPRVHTATVTLVPTTADTLSGRSIVTAIRPDPWRDVFDLIPEHFGQDETIVYRCREVMNHIQTPELRRFMSQVFSIPKVFRCFWTCPASQKHHHNYVGGLAVHSMEVAESVMSNPHLVGMERDLAIAYATLHDVGKIWCYGDSGLYAEPLGHEMATLSHLHPQLCQLGDEWRDGEIALRSLFSGLWKIRGHKPIMAIAKLVQGLDQVSTEQDLRKSTTCDPKFKPWTPKDPWDFGL